MACGCGCGGEPNRGKTYLRGHHRLGKTLERAKALKDNPTRLEAAATYLRQHALQKLTLTRTG